jgi:hypothetical protein
MSPWFFFPLVVCRGAVAPNGIEFLKAMMNCVVLKFKRRRLVEEVHGLWLGTE